MNQIDWQKHVVREELSSDVKERKMTPEEIAWMEQIQEQRKFRRGPRRKVNPTWPKQRKENKHANV
ncbi:hypothetical protein SAMN05192534_12433 [Alteribacillus persepolensis]|uniref:Uncharacterized protein n=1 Tax=Alteribacillus persepolensis TaxID=568899 RepID=A0A1G8IIA5_9BACI|nr:hypothetical protein [Alteribacillus persepolensis]SDI18635.1 hypothetical protein SAMN05192534_12433 [Alteribacillus persepolensis]